MQEKTMVIYRVPSGTSKKQMELLKSRTKEANKIPLVIKDSSVKFIKIESIGQ